MIKDYFILALRNLRKRKLRAWLTMLGIFISVATIFVLISLSIGLQGAVEEQFRLFGTDKFFIQPLGQFGPPGTETGAKLTDKDAEFIKKVNGVKDVTYYVLGNAEVEFKDEIRYKIVGGIPGEGWNLYIETGAFKPEEGSLLEEGDVGEVMLGSYFKYNNVFSEEVNAGDRILINGREFKVKAIVSPIGNPSDDQNIYLGIEDFRELFPQTEDRVDAIIVQINEGQDIKEVAETTDRQLMKFRDVDERTKDFPVLTPEDLLESFKVILNIITGFLIGVAAISLIVGAVGITNTMYTSVLERTKEIGVMKAIGGKNKDILMIFLIESGMLGLVGGIVGVILGFGIGKLIEFIVFKLLDTSLLQTSSPLWLILVCLAFAFLTGIIAGTIPAWRAAKTNVVDALRYE